MVQIHFGLRRLLEFDEMKTLLCFICIRDHVEAQDTYFERRGTTR